MKIIISTLVHSFCFFLFFLFPAIRFTWLLFVFVRLNDQCHVFAVGQTGFLALPQSGVDCEGVDGHRQMLGVHLRETLAARVVLEEFVEHVVGNLLGSVAVEFVDFFPFGVEGVEGAELALAVAEEDQEVLALLAGDLLEHALLGLSVHHAGEDAVLDGVEYDGTIRTRRRLLVKSRTDIVLI